MPVDGWQQRVGELDAWVSEGGRWLGRVRHADGRVSFLDQNEIRPTASGAQAPGREPGTR